MLEVIQNTHKVRANKNHKCDYCGGIIQKGELYDSTTLKSEDIYVWKNHVKCGFLCNELDMEGDEGITADDFNEYICDAYDMITDEYRSFADKIDYLYEHHKNK